MSGSLVSGMAYHLLLAGNMYYSESIQFHVILNVIAMYWQSLLLTK